MRTDPVAFRTGIMDSAQKPSVDDEVHRRIAALKARKPISKSAPDEFQFDPTQPLRLKRPREPAPDK